VLNFRNQVAQLDLAVALHHPDPANLGTLDRDNAKQRGRGDPLPENLRSLVREPRRQGSFVVPVVCDAELSDGSVERVAGGSRV
jgi:hypothetical protein